MQCQTCVGMVRWTARIVGLAFFALISYFVVAHAVSPEGLPNFWKEPLSVRLDLVALCLMTVGGVVGWKWEGLAAVMNVGGYALWQAVERHLPWPPGLIEIALAVGLLYAACWWSSRHACSPPRPAPS